MEFHAASPQFLISEIIVLPLRCRSAPIALRHPHRFSDYCCQPSTSAVAFLFFISSSTSGSARRLTTAISQVILLSFHKQVMEYLELLTVEFTGNRSVIGTKKVIEQKKISNFFLALGVLFCSIFLVKLKIQVSF